MPIVVLRLVASHLDVNDIINLCNANDILATYCNDLVDYSDRTYIKSTDLHNINIRKINAIIANNLDYEIIKNMIIGARDEYYGSQPDAKEEAAHEILKIACEYGSLNVLRRLIDDASDGLDMYIKLRRCPNPQMIVRLISKAIKYNRIDTMRYLMTKINIRQNIKTILHAAIRYNRLDILLYLMAKVNIEKSIKFILLGIVNYGNIDSLKCVLDNVYIDEFMLKAACLTVPYRGDTDGIMMRNYIIDRFNLEECYFDYLDVNGNLLSPDCDIKETKYLFSSPKCNIL